MRCRPAEVHETIRVSTEGPERWERAVSCSVALGWSSGLAAARVFLTNLGRERAAHPQHAPPIDFAPGAPQSLRYWKITGQGSGELARYKGKMSRHTPSFMFSTQLGLGMIFAWISTPVLLLYFESEQFLIHKADRVQRPERWMADKPQVFAVTYNSHFLCIHCVLWNYRN